MKRLDRCQGFSADIHGLQPRVPFDIHLQTVETPGRVGRCFGTSVTDIVVSARRSVASFCMGSPFPLVVGSLSPSGGYHDSSCRA